MNRMIAPLSILQDALREVTRRGSADWPAGLSRWDDTVELLLAPSWQNTRRRLRVVLTDDFEPPRWLAPLCAGVLMVGRTSRRGEAAGLLATDDGRLEPLDSLRLVGPGMHALRLPGRAELAEYPPAPDGVPLRQRWSRTIGVLGPAWQRLVGLRFGLIGAGRTGSVLARGLLRVGVRRLTLIDPDVLQRHNLGESDDCLGEKNVGRAKVDALRDALLPLCRWAEISTVAESVTHVRAIAAMKACDFLVSCTDHDSARLAAACAAALYCRPMIDVATGIARRPEGRMGASVRLILPTRCLVCTGGLGLAEARDVLASGAVERAFHLGRRWDAERQGSLASLNHLAAALAQRMIEDLVAERIRETTWLHLEYDDHGRAVIIYPPLPAAGAAPCPVCSALSGLGDEGLPQVPDIIRSANGQPQEPVANG